MMNGSPGTISSVTKSQRTTPSSYISKSIPETEDLDDGFSSKAAGTPSGPTSALKSKLKKGKTPSSADISVSFNSDPVNSTQQGTISDGSSIGAMGEFPPENLPDLTYFCTSCNDFVSLVHLQSHKTVHQALQVMSLQITTLPRTAQGLLQHRSKLLLELKQKANSRASSASFSRPDSAHNDGPEVQVIVNVQEEEEEEEDSKRQTPLSDYSPGFHLNEVTRLDWAYETLKQYIEDTFDSCHREEPEDTLAPVEVQTLRSELSYIDAVGVGSTQNPYWKSTMEDAAVFQDCFGHHANKAYIGVFDGHNGSQSCHLTAAELHHTLLQEMAKSHADVKCFCTYNMLVQPNTVSKFPDPDPPLPGVSTAHISTSNPTHQMFHSCPEVTGDLTPEPNSPQSPSTNKDLSPKGMSRAFVKAYKETDRMMAYGIEESSRNRWSGCSALTVVMESTAEIAEIEAAVNRRANRLRMGTTEEQSQEQAVHIGNVHVANAGSVHAVLVRGNKAHRLSRAHDTSSPKECQRIIAKGGSISPSGRDARVNGILSSTRGLGNHGDVSLRKCVTCEPSVRSVPIDQYSQFMICATNGLWEVFTPQEAADIVLQMLPSNRLPTPTYISPSIAMLLSTVKEEQEEVTGSPKPEVPAGLGPNVLSNPTSPAAPGSKDDEAPGTSGQAAGKSPASSAEMAPASSAEKDPASSGEKDPASSGETDPSSPVENNLASSADRPKSAPKQAFPDEGEGVTASPNHVDMVDASGTKNAHDPIATTTVAGENGPMEASNEQPDNVSTTAMQVDDAVEQASNGSSEALADLTPALTQSELLCREFTQAMSKRLVQAALLGGSRDNITVVVVLFPGSLLT